MNDCIILKNCRIIGDRSIREDSSILIQNGIIADISDIAGFEASEYAKVYDMKGNYVSAGFVDIHTHGGGGADFMDATDDAFDTALGYQLENGVTGVVATSLTAAYEDICCFMDKAREYMRANPDFTDMIYKMIMDKLNENE